MLSNGGVKEESGPQPPGRPRDASIDERVLAVTRELLIETGWRGLSVRAVAQRAGVGRASLNLRWPSKAALVLHAILGDAPDLTPFEGTDVTGWIDFVVRGSRQLFSRPDVSAAAPGVLLALQEDAELRSALWAGFSGPAVELFVADVEATTPSQRASADLNARAMLAAAAGAALFMSTVAVDDDSDALENRIVKLLTAGFRSVEGDDTGDRP